MTAAILNFSTHVERAIKACPRIPRSWSHRCAGMDGFRIQVFTPMGQPCKSCGKEYRMNE